MVAITWLVVGCGSDPGQSAYSPDPSSVENSGGLVVPRAALTLSLAPGLEVGEVSTYTVTGAAAGETVQLLGSTNGFGNTVCPPPLGGLCLGLAPPVSNLGSATADPQGVALIQIVPPAPAGAKLATQAVIERGAGGSLSVASDARADKVFAPFVSGLPVRPANPTCLAPPAPPVFDDEASVVRAFPALTFDRPTTMAQPPGDPDTWWVTTQGGKVVRFDDDDAVATASLVLDIEAEVDDAGFEQGLLGFAFHPDFATNGFVYVSYTTDRGAADFSEVTRYTSLDGGLTLDPTTATLIFELEQPFDNHNGGNVLFGPDGLLYLGFGDGGSGGDPFENGQNTFVLLGKMLRIDVDHGLPYTIPADNPFADGLDGLPEIYAWGMRNPWRWSFDRVTDELWVGDVGQDEREEIDIVERGGNYGWNLMEGFLCFGGVNCNKVPDLQDPIFDYENNFGAAVIGGYVYRGTEVPALLGTYLFSDNFTDELWGLQFDENGEAHRFVVDDGLNFGPVTFAESAEGELYMTGSNGQIHRIEAAGPPVVDPFPRLLSDTGCVDPSDPSVPVDGVIPYAVNSTQWLDRVQAERWFAIPDGTTIDVDADGDFDLPIGSVTIQQWSKKAGPAETRLFVRHDDGTWAGYTYAWNDAGTDAELVEDAHERAECVQCHTDVAGRTIGLELGQLNKSIAYPSTGIKANQLATLDAVGFFTDPLGLNPNMLPKLADPKTAVASVGAPSLLHANCASCHQPGGPTSVDIDLRIGSSNAERGCLKNPKEGDLGVPGALIIDPGNSALSVLSLRMHETDVHRMPPADELLDITGIFVVDGWINTLPANCQ